MTSTSPAPGMSVKADKRMCFCVSWVRVPPRLSIHQEELKCDKRRKRLIFIPAWWANNVNFGDTKRRDGDWIVESLAGAIDIYAITSARNSLVRAVVRPLIVLDLTAILPLIKLLFLSTRIQCERNWVLGLLSIVSFHCTSVCHFVLWKRTAEEWQEECAWDKKTINKPALPPQQNPIVLYAAPLANNENLPMILFSLFSSFFSISLR